MAKLKILRYLAIRALLWGAGVCLFSPPAMGMAVYDLIMSSTQGANYQFKVIQGKAVSECGATTVSAKTAKQIEAARANAEEQKIADLKLQSTLSTTLAADANGLPLQADLPLFGSIQHMTDVAPRTLALTSAQALTLLQNSTPRAGLAPPIVQIDILVVKSGAHHAPAITIDQLADRLNASLPPLLTTAVDNSERLRVMFKEIKEISRRPWRFSIRATPSDIIRFIEGTPEVVAALLPSETWAPLQPNEVHERWRLAQQNLAAQIRDAKNREGLYNIQYQTLRFDTSSASRRYSEGVRLERTWRLHHMERQMALLAALLNPERPREEPARIAGP